MSRRAAHTLRMAAGALAAIATVAAPMALGPLAGDAAAAVTAPTVYTGKAVHIGYASATLEGTVTPNGGNTSYYFQYGLTNAYGGQTTIADAGSGTSKVNVSLPITGLQPLTVYHYRLVAVNGVGPTIGGDRTLLTKKIPLSLQILSSPNPVLFGGPVTVQGTLSGTENGNRELILQQNQFPFTVGFQNAPVNPVLTTATGGYTFTVSNLTLATQFRVVTATSPPVLSPVATEEVAVHVDAHLASTRRRRFARIYGTVSPAEDGMQVGFLRISHGRGVLAGGTVLLHRNATSSRFSRVVPVKAGVYRVLIRITNGAQISTYSQPLVIR
jgi:hypothetical protein